jgi:hypothetical protein
MANVEHILAQPSGWCRDAVAGNRRPRRPVKITDLVTR